VQKQYRKQSDSNRYDRDEREISHFYKAQKTLQNRKMMKNLDKALRNKDYKRLTQVDDDY
jgi:hypothetical protein